MCASFAESALNNRPRQLAKKARPFVGFVHGCETAACRSWFKTGSPVFVSYPVFVIKKVLLISSRLAQGVCAVAQGCSRLMVQFCGIYSARCDASFSRRGQCFDVLTGARVDCVRPSRNTRGSAAFWQLGCLFLSTTTVISERSNVLGSLNECVISPRA